METVVEPQLHSGFPTTDTTDVSDNQTVQLAKARGIKVLLFTNGSRGDVQPFVALAGALQQAGFVVQVGTNACHVKFVTSFDIQALPTALDIEEHWRQPSMRTAMATGDMFACAKALAISTQKCFPEFLQNKMRAIDEFKPDLILTSPLDNFETVPLASCRGIPYICVGLQFFVPTRYLRTMLQEPSWAPHLLMHYVFLRLIRQAEHDGKAEELLRRCPETKPWVNLNLHEFAYDIFHPIGIQILGVSPAMGAIPDDWSADLKILMKRTGHWVVNKSQQKQRIRQGDSKFGGGNFDILCKFLADEPPVYIGWGSMIAKSEEHMAVLAVRALLGARKRGIILGGWAKLNANMLEGQRDSRAMIEYARDNVLFIESAPHEWLFPQCSAIIHHGGAGTTASALRSGVPSIITPCAFDQWEHARLVDMKGVGVGMRHLSKVAPKELVSAIQKCTTDVRIINAAKSFGKNLIEEDGLGNAVKLIDDFVCEEVQTGEWDRKFAEHSRKRAALRAQRPIGCFGWIGRICFSSKPNEFQ